MKHTSKRKKIVDVSYVPDGMRYWRDKLLAYCLNLFKYDNLPSSLPTREIEANLILTGHCVLFKDNNYGLVTCESDLYGYDEYYNPTMAVYAQPVLKSKRLDIHGNAEVIYNSVLQNQVLGDYVDGGLLTFISRYARMFADIDSTFSIATVNERAPFMPSTKDSVTLESVNDFFDKIKDGKCTVVADDSIIPSLKMIDLGTNRTNNTKLIDYLYARDKLFECFMREIGIIFYQTKRAQVNVAEVNVNDRMCTFMIDDMLQSREDGINRVNKLFGLNISVSINPRISLDEREAQK